MKHIWQLVLANFRYFRQKRAAASANTQAPWATVAIMSALAAFHAVFR
jgi:hypothetical protein